MTLTRTHTVFFDEDSLKPLRAEITKLEEDYRKRRPYMDSDIAERFDLRFKLLDSATNLLGEWAD